MPISPTLQKPRRVHPLTSEKKKVIEIRSEILRLSSTPCQVSGSTATAHPSASGTARVTPDALATKKHPFSASFVTTKVTATCATIVSLWAAMPLWYPSGYCETNTLAGVCGMLAGRRAARNPRARTRPNTGTSRTWSGL